MLNRSLATMQLMAQVEQNIVWEELNTGYWSTAGTDSNFTDNVLISVLRTRCAPKFKKARSESDKFFSLYLKFAIFSKDAMVQIIRGLVHMAVLESRFTVRFGRRGRLELHKAA